VDNVKLSRVVSHALRHEPWLYELELDEGGWVPIEALLDAIRPEDASWAALTESDLEQMMALSDKKRHEIRGGKIRARYGHSTPQRLLMENAVPPDVLFHGTSSGTAEIIMRQGIKPMGRQFVHLSVDLATAEKVARRKSGVPVVLSVAAKAASSAGLRFYLGNDVVWLADGIPPQFINGRLA
jgi:putative RNA 2'-phosphotransferase